MAKKKNKKSKRRLAFFGTLSLFIILYFVFNLCYYSYHIMVLKKSKMHLENELVMLKDNEQILSSDIQKLKDPEYIAKYARENYMYSKDGEYIIKVDNKVDEVPLDDDSDYRYLITIGVLGVIIVFLYIFKKRKD